MPSNHRITDEEIQDVCSTDLEAVLVRERDVGYSRTLTNLSRLSDSSNNILRNYAIDSDEESPSIFEEKSTHKTPGRQKEKFLNFGR